MIYSIVYRSEVGRANRFDAEYFKPEYLEIERKLKRIGSQYFGDGLIKITGGATPLGAKYLEKGIPFLRVQNIMQNYFNDDLVYISKSQNKEIERSILRTHDVLLTITGVSYGKSAIVEQRYDKANINQHSVVMRFKNGLSPYYVSTFLNCKYGKKQSDRNIVGLSRPALDYQRIKKYFLIPLLSEVFQSEVGGIVKEAHEKQRESKQLYQGAEALLLKELGLLGYEPKNRLSFETTKREVDQAKRFDVEYFQPKYKEIIEKIEEYKGGFDLVKNIVSWKKGTEVGSKEYTEHGKAFIRVSDFSIHGVEETAKKISEQLFKETQESFQPQKGDILFTKDATIGICNVLTKNIEGIVSSAFLRLNLKDAYKNFEKECLALILNSIICKLQVKKLSGGAIIEHLKPSDFEAFKIPLISASIQAEIAKKVTESHCLRNQSKDFLNIAKQAVELAIEDNEFEGLAFIKKSRNES